MTAVELRKEMEQRDLKPSELADALGRSRPAVSKWLSGDRPVPEQEIRLALARHDGRAEGVKQERARLALALRGLARDLDDLTPVTAKTTAATVAFDHPEITPSTGAM